MRDWITLVEQASDDDLYIGFDLSTVPADKLAELSTAGYDTDEVLYHGTRYEFDEFDRKELRTANHFYTAPDPRTAAYYGDTIYACFGKQDPQADLTDDSREAHKLLKQIATALASDYEGHVEDSDEDLEAVRRNIVERLFAEHEDDEDYDQWDAENDAKRTEEYRHALHNAATNYLIEIMTSAGSELYGLNGSLQNSVMSECFGMGYKSVRIYDPNSQGDPISVIFQHATDITIIGRLR